MDVLRLPLHMLENLCADVADDQGGIAADDLSFIFLIAFDLSQILIRHINDEIRVIIGKLRDRVQQHTCQCVHRVFHFENLRVHGSKELLIDSVKALDFRHGYFKVLNRPPDLEAVELHFRRGLNQDFGHGNRASGILAEFLHKLLF